MAKEQKGSVGGFVKKESGFGSKTVGPQGSRKGGSKGSDVKHVSNPRGLNAKSMGSKKRGLGVQGNREGMVGK